MPAVFIGRPSSGTDKVLRRSEYSKERNGLETLTETYTIRTSSRISLQPAKNQTHASYSSAAQTFPRMQVEGVAFQDLDGELTEMLITYVGLTSSSGLPPAIVRILPVNGAGIYGPPINIQVEFVTDVNETQFVSGMHNQTTAFYGRTFKQMPTHINGTKLPDNPKAPFSQQLVFGTGGNLSKHYLGYTLQDQQCERRGAMLVATNIYSESETFTGGLVVP